METKRFSVSLSLSQMELLYETIKGFGEHKKMIHLPTAAGAVEEIPLPGEILQKMMAFHEKKGAKDPQPIDIVLQAKAEGETAVRLTWPTWDETLEYDVDADEYQKE